MLDIVLIIILVISLITDIKHRKILNIATFPAIVLGAVYHVITNGWQGLLFSGNGMLLGFALLFIPFLLGGMGAGDVKLMTAIGALKGSVFVFHAFLYTCLYGGVLALGILMVRKQLKQSAIRVTNAVAFRQLSFLSKDEFGFPYGVAIVLGAITAMVWGDVL